MGGSKQVSSHCLWNIGSIEGWSHDFGSQLTCSIDTFGKTARITHLTSDQKACAILAIAVGSEGSNQMVVEGGK